MIWDERDQQAMRHGLTDWQIFHAAWAEVWREMRIACPWPRTIHPHPRHQWALVRPPHPVARSWLGGPRSDPPAMFDLTHLLTEGHTMRKRSIFTIPAAAAGIIALGLTVGAMTPDHAGGVAAPTPSAVAFTLPEPLLAAATCTEDEPCWKCEEMGNLICGTMPAAMMRSAWKAWDANGGAEALLVNPRAQVSLTGYATADPYAPDGPALGVHQLALHDSGVWYIFTTNTI